jgi:hypothetical protein
MSVHPRLLTKLVAFDTAHLVQYTRSSLHDPAGDTLFYPSLSLIPRHAKAAFLATCGAMAVYTVRPLMYCTTLRRSSAVSSFANRIGPGHRSLTSHGRPYRPFGTSTSDACSSYMVHAPVARCWINQVRVLAHLLI